MNIDEQAFQKRLALRQLVATIITAAGAVILAFGWALLLFSSELIIDSVEASEETKQYLEIFIKTSSNVGLYMTLGGFLLFGGPLLMMFMIIKDKVKHKKINFSKFQILVDEMYDGKDLGLKEKGYDAYSVKKLRLEGKSLRYDYSVLNYAKDNSMILITEDPENIGGCKENNLPCIGLGQNPSVEGIIKELELLKKDKRD